MILFVSFLAAASAADTGSPLWDDLLTNCKSAPFSCVQHRIRSYVETTLAGDVNLTQAVSFVKNSNSYRHRARSKPVEDPQFAAVVDAIDTIQGQTPSPGPKYNVYGLSELLYDRGVSFLMNHDLKFTLPKFLGGGTVSLSPRSLEEDGALIKFSYKNDEDEETSKGVQPRILFKRIKKFFNKKLLTSFLAALLIIALIKIKILFFFPLVVGVGAAKKLLLKVLLFLFPALTHLFKLCAYYHHQHVKYHHHHHQIAHHHHHVPVPVSSYHSLPEYLEHPPSSGWSHRNDVPDVELSSWGIEPPIEDNRLDSPKRKYFDENLVYPIPTQSKELLPLGGVYDVFYSPILDKLDVVFSQLGFHDEGCRERLVCSMYKAPARFSPHSNLVSAQLSRDPIELQKPKYTNAAVTRFYRYVQAARDGQDNKSCLSLYPTCKIITE